MILRFLLKPAETKAFLCFLGNSGFDCACTSRQIFVGVFNSLVIYLQVRSPTGVHGKAASGALHEAMSSPDTSGSTLEQSHSNAATATGECADKCIFTMARAAFHEFKKKKWKQRKSRPHQHASQTKKCELLFDLRRPSRD